MNKISDDTILGEKRQSRQAIEEFQRENILAYIEREPHRLNFRRNQKNPDKRDNHFIVPNVEFLRKMSDVIMVVVVLIATMAFQAAVSPPGGVWQDHSSTHRAGEAVIASTNPELYKNFVRANMVAFVSSLITIFLLTTGLPSGHPFLMAAVMYTMWVSLASIGVSYGASVMVITPNLETLSLASVVKIVLVVSLSFYGIIILFLWIMRLYPWWKSTIQQWVDSNCVGIRPFSRFVFHLLDYLYQIWF